MYMYIDEKNVVYSVFSVSDTLEREANEKNSG